MNKKYNYSNGKPARILCTDGYVKKYPVISMTIGGSIYSHNKTGDVAYSVSDAFNLVEAWAPAEGEWSLFSVDNETYSLRKFRSIINGLYTDAYGAAWEYCYKFDGTLPYNTGEEK